MSAKHSFIDIVNQYLESDRVTLPVFNVNAARIQQELAKKEPDIKEIEKIITSDQSLSSQVMKIANSSFYRGLADITTVRGAIMRLGMREIQKIVLLATTKNAFQIKDPMISLIMKRLWQHSIGTAYGAVWLCKRNEYGVDQSQAFFAGLFHDVGKLFLLMVIDQIKKTNKQANITPSLLLEAMNRLHTSQGYKLLHHWNMPEQFAVVARDHHTHDYNTGDTLLLLVRMANLVCGKLGISTNSPLDIVLPTTQEAHLLNLSELDLAELEIYLEDTKVLSA